MKKRIVICLLFVTIISGIIGFVTGRLVEVSSNNESSMGQNIVEEGESDVTNITSDNNNKYPFPLYVSFLSSSSNIIIDKINNNPIDEYYLQKYLACKSAAEEQECLSEWNNAYEKELINAKNRFELMMKSEKFKDSEYASDLKNAFDKYINSSMECIDATAKIAYYFEEVNLGRGSGHTYDILSNKLEMNRVNTLKLIECIYLSGEKYEWTQPAE